MVNIATYPTSLNLDNTNTTEKTISEADAAKYDFDISRVILALDRM